MAVKIKEMKDDAIFNVKLNKNFYLMVKELAFYLFTSQSDSEKLEAALKNMTTKQYAELDMFERAFFTTTLLITEIEAIAKKETLFTEKEVLQPGDEGYVAPTQD
jgi:hypothetical protein